MLGLFLVVFPAVSWLYLKRGFNYRKQILKELEQKIPFTDTLLTSDSTLISFKGKCTLLSLTADQNTLNGIYRQFKEARGFQLVSNVNSEEFRKEYKKSNSEIDVIIRNSYKRVDSLQFEKLKQQYGGKAFVLIDSLNQVRNTYTENDVAKLISHIPPLLPYYDEKKMR